jgi:hypothetical protein
MKAMRPTASAAASQASARSTSRARSFTRED